MVQMKSEGIPLENSLLLRLVGLFILFRPLADWMTPNHVMESNLLYSKCTDLNANVMQKLPAS